MKKMKIVLPILLFVFPQLIFCQTNTLSKADYPQVISPSPEAAALGKYGDVPISLFSGTPQIAVPIYQCKNGDIEINIGLSYNAGGIRLDDVATNVGLGWALNAGGVITRSVLGIPDQINDGTFPGNSFDPNMVTMNSFELNPATTACIAATNAVNNNEDFEKDIYYFNFLGVSGKFVFDSTRTPRLIPANPNIKIEPYDGTFYNNGFIITDDKGVKYYFNGVTEGPLNVTYNCITGGSSPREYESNFTSSWYLTKIMSPDKRNFYFEYESYFYTTEKSYSEVEYLRQRIVDGCADLSNKNRKCLRLETIYGQRIKRIYSTNNLTKVEFEYATTYRQDLKYNGQNAGNYLEGVNVYNNNILRKNWSFTYDYFGSGNAKRLKLLTAKEDDRPAYVFTYDEAYTLPDRFSLAQDHWGYYNGKSNSTLIPAIPSIGRPTGSDREGDISYMRTGTLTKIKYPTGGSTVFEYEGHTDQVTEDSTYFVNESATLTITQNQANDSTHFFLPAGATDVNVNWSLVPGNFEDFVYGYIKDSADNTIYKSYQNSSGTQNITGFLTDNHSYKLFPFRSTIADPVYLQISWKKPITNSVTHTKIVFGGLRIKSVKNFDSVSGLAGAKYYYYNSLDTPSRSTVVLPASITKEYYSIYEGLNSVSQTPVSDVCRYNVLSSSSIPIIGNGLDNAIGYRQVVVKDSANTKLNGRTIYRYSVNSGEVGAAIGNGNTDWCKGFLLDQIDQKYDAVSHNFKDVRRIKNYYQAVYNDTCYLDDSKCSPTQTIIPNLKISYTRQPISLPNGAGFGLTGTYPGIFNVEKYFSISAVVHLVQSNETMVDTVNGTSITVSTHYFYENDSSHIYVTKTETVDSKGQLIRKQNKYPFDLVSSGTPNIYNAMVRRNIVGPVLEETATNVSNSQEIAKKQTSYQSWNGLDSLIKPYQFMTSVGGNTLQSDLTFSNYDTIGNILGYTGRDQIATSFIWDYQHQLPIAKCINSDSYAIAFTSFEADGKGNWTYTGSPTDDLTAPTGKKCYQLSGGNITKSAMTSMPYLISYWGKNGSAHVNGVGPTRSGKVIGDWVYYEHEITATSVTISGNKYIDELRLYPKDAQLTTYTYLPLVGMSSQCDANNRITYYEYDTRGRLNVIRNEDKLVLKKICYNYADQAEDCTVDATPIWQSTGVTRCQPCSLNTSYISNVLQQEERDLNLSSTTYGQTRWYDLGISGSCIPPANWQNTTVAIRCRTVSGSYTGEREQEQQDMNPCSPTGSQLRWVVIDQNCSVCPKTANWQATGNYQCVKDGSNNNTGYREQEERDQETCSSTFNQTRWVNIGVNCTACAKAANWQVTGNYRCVKDGSNNNTGYQEREEIDQESCSSTYNQTRWVNIGVNCTTCPKVANWQSTGNYRCVKDGSNENTGYQEREERDQETCSSTYNQTRWVNNGYNVSACPLPCNSSTCSGNNKRCINGVCETGVLSATFTEQKKVNGVWVWRCTYRYCFSDGIQSTYSEFVDYAEPCSLNCFAD